MPKFVIKGVTLPKEPTVEIALRLNPDGTVGVQAIDEHSNEWALLNISKSGNVGFYKHIPEHLGFELDFNRELMVDGEFKANY